MIEIKKTIKFFNNPTSPKKTLMVTVGQMQTNVYVQIIMHKLKKGSKIDPSQLLLSIALFCALMACTSHHKT